MTLDDFGGFDRIYFSGRPYRFRQRCGKSPSYDISNFIALFKPDKFHTSGAFQAGSTDGAADCEKALVAAVIERANVKNDPSFRIFQSF